MDKAIKAVRMAQLAWSGIRFAKLMKDAGERLRFAGSGREWSAAALGFAKMAQMLEAFEERAGWLASRLGEGPWGLGLGAAAAGARVGMGGARALAAFAADAAQGDGRVGDLARLQGLRCERDWAACRMAKLATLEAGGAVDGARAALEKVGAALSAMSLMPVAIALRGEAQRLREAGGLDRLQAYALACRVRAAAGDVERIFLSSDSAKAMASIGRKTPSQERAAKAKREQFVEMKIGAWLEEAQICWLGGMEEEAREILGRAAKMPMRSDREAAKARLAKELCEMRGNDARFCSWAKGAMGMG